MKCKTCRIELTDLNRYPNNKSRCKQCINNSAKEWRKKNPDKIKKQKPIKRGEYHKSAECVNQRNACKIRHFFNNIWVDRDIPKVPITTCCLCGIELNMDNWGQGRRDTNNHVCRVCDNKRTAGYLQKNPVFKERAKKYYELNKERIKEIRIHKTNNPIIKQKIKERNKLKYQTNKIKYLELWAKRNGHGFKPLNEHFEGADGHHINQEDVIFIPMYIHRSIPHHHKDQESMQSINMWAIFWLIYGSLEDHEMVLPKWVF